jgi:tripartite-type tricarboxylate transporter receptor subunit TctC
MIQHAHRVLALSAVLMSSLAWAQSAGSNYPNKPVRLVVGFAPGGAADYVARTVGDALGKALGQSVVIDNRAGAGSSIAAEIVAKSPADGYTLLIASPSSISVNPALNPKLGYKPSDLLPVTKVTSSPLVIAVSPSTGINSVKDLIARAKQAPGALNYATSGNGSAPHLGAALFGMVAGVEMTHVPFRGGGPAIQSMLAGDTQITFGTPPSVLPWITAGRLKGLGVSTLERSPLVPDLPGMKEAGLPDYVIEFWYGFFVPANTPPAIAQKIFTATQQALQQPQVKAALAREGTEVSLSTSPAQFASFLTDNEKFWVRLVKEAAVKIE